MNEKHGLGRRIRTHRLYNRWDNMKRRCLNSNTKDFPRYGGRGITVCERWLSFKNFRDDMFDSYEEGLTLERVDNNGSYSKENCRWVTRKEQGRNRRNNILIEIDGVEKCVVEWAEEFNISKDTVYRRISAGWPPVEAVTTPRLEMWSHHKGSHHF